MSWLTIYMGSQSSPAETGEEVDGAGKGKQGEGLEREEGVKEGGEL